MKILYHRELKLRFSLDKWMNQIRILLTILLLQATAIIQVIRLSNYGNSRTIGAFSSPGLPTSLRKIKCFANYKEKRNFPLVFNWRLQFFSWRRHVYVFRINSAISNLLSEKPETGYRYIIYLQNGDR
jgi:hypothetical protein